MSATQSNLKLASLVICGALALGGCVETVSTTDIYEPVYVAPRGGTVIVEEEYRAEPSYGYRSYGYGAGRPYRQSYYGGGYYGGRQDYRREIIREQARANLEAQKNAIRNEREYQKRLFRRQRDLGLL